MGDPHTAFQPAGKGGCAQRNDHKFLNIDVIGGVAAAVQDVHHGAGQAGVPPGQVHKVTPQRDAPRGSGGMGSGQADCQNRIGAQPGFIPGAVRFAQGAVDGALVGGVQPRNGFGQLTVHCRDGRQHPLAAVAVGVAVPLFAGFVPAGGGPAGNGGGAGRPVLQGDLCPDGGVAPAVEDLKGLYFGDGGIRHGFLLWFAKGAGWRPQAKPPLRGGFGGLRPPVSAPPKRPAAASAPCRGPPESAPAFANFSFYR